MEKPPHNLPLPKGAELDEGAAAIAEAAAVAGGLDLSSRKDLNRLNKLLRRDEMDGHLHRILVIGLYVFALCVVLMFGSLVFSLAFPSRTPLTDSQFDTLRDFLFSGGVGAAIAAAARKVSDGKGED